MDIARAGYQNSTCEEERFKNPLRGECQCMGSLRIPAVSSNLHRSAIQALLQVHVHPPSHCSDYNCVLFIYLFSFVFRIALINSDRVIKAGTSTEESGVKYKGPSAYQRPRGKSNRKMIQNSIMHCCLGGEVNKEAKIKCLEVCM